MTALTYSLTAALALQEVRVNINEPTASKCSDEEINNWVIQASADTALKGLGVIKSDTVTLATGDMTYTALASAGAGAVAKIIRVVAAAYDTSMKGLLRINPVALMHYPTKTAGEPDYFFHLNTIFGVYPIPSAAEDTDSVTVWFSEAADAITDLPDYHQHFAIWFATSMAFGKMNRGQQANYWMQMYLNGILAARADLYDPPPDSADKRAMPDRTVAAQ